MSNYSVCSSFTSKNPDGSTILEMPLLKYGHREIDYGYEALFTCHKLKLDLCITCPSILCISK